MLMVVDALVLCELLSDVDSLILNEAEALSLMLVDTELLSLIEALSERLTLAALSLND